MFFFLQLHLSISQINLLNSIFLEKFQKIKPEQQEAAIRSTALFFIIGILENTDKKAKLLSLEELITKKSIELSMRQQVEQRCRKVHCTFSVILEQSEANMTQCQEKLFLFSQPSWIFREVTNWSKMIINKLEPSWSNFTVLKVKKV